MVLPTDDCFVFVIKTDEHAGNFEREMCAYITGALGTTDVGAKESEKFQKQYPAKYNDFEDLVADFSDEYGGHTPVTVWDHDDCSCVVIFFNTRPSDKLLMFMRLRAVKFSVGRGINVLGFELLEYKVKYTEELVDKWGVGS